MHAIHCIVIFRNVIIALFNACPYNTQERLSEMEGVLGVAG